VFETPIFPPDTRNVIRRQNASLLLRAAAPITHQDVRRAATPFPHAMQLRVARLCLDCEELHVGSACPVCASERYAFLSAWLPSEERRRWRRPAPASEPASALTAVRQTIARWVGGEPPPEPHRSPRTRASDFVPQSEFQQLQRDAPTDPQRAANSSTITASPDATK
jgi:hypothetical protein